MALIRCHAHHRVCPSTHARLTAICLSTRIAIVAHAAIGFRRIGAHAGHGIANACDVALIRRAAYDRVCPGTHARLARIRCRARVVVIANRAIHFGGVRANTRSRLARSRVVAAIRRGTRGDRTTHAVHAETTLAMRTQGTCCSVRG